ncbi:GGDEF domain-containing protein [Chitinimonas sp. BJB300]|uniref:GGDEF domain-containing protein n=1 Tax=Chitinimonas sp. BJB300 TaxID=1559339 RepID=UPI000C0E02BE|nr:GGDEF domain-containing protein [Chitinimonas sp. BJB300]PHV13412.1 GGDEF domain-containing protein [Chitinimonas sp. BJB300]TSJ89732.1 GGDEF domain-containing protein [Chitinimonas sp. BJB300]
MKQTDQTLLEQLRITDFEIENRKSLFTFSEQDAKCLGDFKFTIEKELEKIVNAFYLEQTAIPEIALLIGDADTLNRLRNAQRKYIIDIFSGVYDLEYVNNRLRIGLIHKRIGVEPKLYLAAVYSLNTLLNEYIASTLKQSEERIATTNALAKLFMFDVSLVFETYIRSLVSEIEISKNKSEQYARSLEDKVGQRTKELEELSRTDPLTGLLNVRHLNEILTKVLRYAERHSQTVTAVYIDVNDFKNLNDTKGHRKGDQVLRFVSEAIKTCCRREDFSFRNGGDEFCIILPNCDEEQAQEIFSRRLLEEMYKSEEVVSLSIGCASSGPDEHLSADELIQLADERMYQMKTTYKKSKLTSQ